MTVKDWLTTNQSHLEQSGITTARLDCLVLLEDALGKDRAFLLAHPETVIPPASVTTLSKQVVKRAKHTPLAYIRGRTEFYGREFVINKHVLEPRPESETIIDILKRLPEPAHVIDVGTGSGALAITAKLELPQTAVMALDIDPKCLEIARQNCRQHKVNIKVIQNDLLRGLRIQNDTILICNLPYVPDKFTLNQAAMNEPKVAIFGGKDGLDHYRTLFEQVSDSKVKPTHVLTESLPFQHAELTTIARQHNYTQTIEDDFIQGFQMTAGSALTESAPLRV